MDISEPIKQAAEMVGGQAALARLIGARQQQVWNWANLQRQVPAERANAIERATDGRIQVEQLRPDVRWVRVPDPSWPHPGGRPCIDVASPAAQAPA